MTMKSTTVFFKKISSSIAACVMALALGAPLSAEEGGISKMVPFDSEEVAINLEIGDMASRSGDYDSAISAYSRAYLLDNKNFAAIYNLAYTYQMKGALKEALKYYKVSMRMDEKRFEPYLNSGAIYMIENRRDLASEMFKEALKIEPGNISAIFNLAIIDIDGADYKSALARLDGALNTPGEKTGRDYYGLMLKKALCHVALGELEAAAKCLNFQSDDSMEEIEKFYLTGCMLHKSGKTSEAAAAFQKAVGLAGTPETEGILKTLEEKIAQFKSTKKTGRISN
ncbi:MAG TPA: tetratricopeptide repeat protein [Candidatus Wallbacteria bacterium]|nr:MAG: photosystem I assembly protein Ycf3 [bacterium ADurb.Bin243]HOD40659.1 tetratricopeptide repeat protein [Candidatus Wallbacteria bacterium]HPG56904.1 tetratricopeptide repeat protein [Candidatus Wallbacteria bacterium]